jgi:metallo-beta-lactamase family protein
MKIEFVGAAQGVTGSKHLLHINGKKILLDCGLFQGHRKEAILWNHEFTFEPSELDLVVLSHAHIDHSGALPLLVKKGFSGVIYCTHATRDLCGIMLRDSAYIQEREAEWLTKKGEPTEPLYTIEDAEKAISLFRSVSYHQKIRIDNNISLKFKEAGHILGSAMEEWEIYDKNSAQHIRFGFTGDVGRKNLPILKDREEFENLDCMITESTYGNRLHDEVKSVEEQLAKDILATYKKGGKILIPAFAIERTQEILFVLRQLRHERKIPEFPIFIDSPLAVSATGIFELHPECFDEDMQKLLDDDRDPFADDHGVQFIQSVDDSKALNNFPGPTIIISASGMCEFGRIKHHLANTISDSNNLVLIIGYMAANTLGRKLIEGVSPVKIFNTEYDVRAEIKIYNAFSGHGDKNALLENVATAGENLKNIFLVHGELDQQEPLREAMKQLANCKKTEIQIPEPGDIYVLEENKTFKKSSEKNNKTKALFHIE